MNIITYLKKFTPALVILVLMVGMFNFGSSEQGNTLSVLTPSIALATHECSDMFSPLPDWCYHDEVEASCDITASASTVYGGSSVVISWTTKGYSTVTINGDPMSSTSGSKTYTNLQSNTTYSLVAKSTDGGSSASCSASVTVKVTQPPVAEPTCTLSPSSKSINSGESVDLTWSTTNAASASLTSFGSVALSGTKNTGALTSSKTYVLTVLGHNAQTINCYSYITVKQPPTETPYCRLVLTKSVSAQTAKPGAELTYTINIKNEGTGNCTGGGVKIVDVHDENISFISSTNSTNLNAGYGSTPLYTAGTRTLIWNGNTLTPGESGTITWKGKVKDAACDANFVVKNTAKATAYELSNFTQWASSNTVQTAISDVCSVPVPTCDSFVVTPSTITKGNSANLSWTTTNASRVVINNGIGEVAVDGSLSVTPLSTVTYLLTAYGAENKEDTCSVTLTVQEPPVETVPKCESFTATPTSLPNGGGNVTLAWITSNATAVSISPNIGSVSLNGSTTIAQTQTSTYTLTASDSKGKTNTCSVTVPVNPPVHTPITCAANVSYSANPTSISRGDSSTLTWSTTGITGVSFDNGVTATGLSGSVTVSPTSDTTYTLRATDGIDTIYCPATVSVRTGGGGGGGSSAPRCELSVSDNKIKSGDKITLKWDSTRATDLTLEDKNTGKTLVTTKGLDSDEKKDLYEGKITVSPKEDTEYLLTVKRGNSTRKCTVDVDVEKKVVVTQVRDQQPLVAGIALAQVPYTGFEAGPLLTALFYILLMAWALYIAYLLVIRKDTIGGLQLKSASQSVNLIPQSTHSDLFVAQVQTPKMPVSSVLPVNLPTGTPVIGYANAIAEEVVSTVSTNAHQIDDVEMTSIENHAHEQRVLLSSDAIRHFIATTSPVVERLSSLDKVISAAKAKYPAEDGWVVLNEKRMQELCSVCLNKTSHSNEAPYIPTVVPEGAGSLAEAIVTGNVLAAYEMIGNRPMFALADAAADLDSVYRIRRGGEAKASELLMKETAAFTDEQILKMIEALTTALDGTYTDEADAVKMSIMKAMKVVA